mmetsp:Transcript_16378/g.50100  ORF Transcript_16378/g.50100 Transcript_16378/m.50100 type:complete len:212 (-) Transcript_16378:55-690(-)
MATHASPSMLQLDTVRRHSRHVGSAIMRASATPPPRPRRLPLKSRHSSESWPVSGPSSVSMWRSTSSQSLSTSFRRLFVFHRNWSIARTLSSANAVCDRFSSTSFVQSSHAARIFMTLGHERRLSAMLRCSRSGRPGRLSASAVQSLSPSAKCEMSMRRPSSATCRIMGSGVICILMHASRKRSTQFDGTGMSPSSARAAFSAATSSLPPT